MGSVGGSFIQTPGLDGGCNRTFSHNVSHAYTEKIEDRLVLTLLVVVFGHTAAVVVAVVILKMRLAILFSSACASALILPGQKLPTRCRARTSLHMCKTIRLSRDG